MRGRQSLAWRFRSCSRLGRRAHRIGALPVHGLQRMDRKACLRSGIAYLVSWWRVTRVQRFLSTPLFRAHRDKSRTKLVCEASALVRASRRKRPMHRSFCKKSLPYAGAPKPAGRGARGRGVPENRDSQARRVVRSHTHGEPILPPNFRRRVAGVPPVRREALRVGCGFSFSRADVKTPEFRGSFSLKLRELCQI